jgi:hypothetical protein
MLLEGFGTHAKIKSGGTLFFEKKKTFMLPMKSFILLNLETILQQVTHGASWVNTNKKFIQFLLFFHLCSHGHPMATKYMTM